MERPINCARRDANAEDMVDDEFARGSGIGGVNCYKDIVLKNNMARLSSLLLEEKDISAEGGCVPRRMRDTNDERRTGTKWIHVSGF